MSRVLLTGFEPFGTASMNPSQEVVKALGEISGVHLHTAVLPVVFASATPMLMGLVEELRPDLVVCLGQAEGRTAISLERFAVNLMDARIPDNAGVVIRDQRIAPDGPIAYESTLPLSRMQEAISAEGVAVTISLSAGAFLCNHVFYSLLHHLHGQQVRSGFIHLPLLPEQAEGFPGLATMGLADQVKAIRGAISAAAEA